MQIRRAETADEEALASIRRRAILALAVPAMSREAAERWATRGAADRVARAMREHDVWVAVEGAAIGWVEVDRDRVAALYVSPSCARRGVGSALLTFAETSIRSSGYTTARLESSQNALDYYLRRGYLRCGPADSHGAWPLRKDLAAVLGLHDARASAADREWLTNVYPFYLHDLSEFDEHYYTLNDRGLWEPDHLPSWLQDDTDHPLIIRQSETRVGFALVNRAPSADMMPGFRFRLAEFFILKRYRRTGIGLRAAQALFHRFRGPWQLSILACNAPAIAFWRRVLGDQARLQEESGPSAEIVYAFDTDRGKADESSRPLA
jgi:predicted acetyltransferase/predicted N-acetyltransferase YhbS